MYDKDIEGYLTDIFNVYKMYSHRSIINILKKDEIFLLYNTENEFTSSSYICNSGY